jgi:excinuclease ABC subunit B
MAHVIAALNRPTLVISHNKTLAAQLYEEFTELFPENAVEYFVSYYDYYQPEAYIPQRDIYIEKDASRNDDLDRLRLSATSSLVSRRDSIIVASVSCIFGLGSPEDFKRSVVSITAGTTMDRDELLRRLVDLQYSRNDVDFRRGTFRVRGDVVEVHPADEEFAYRIELFGDEVDGIDMSTRSRARRWPRRSRSSSSRRSTTSCPRSGWRRPSRPSRRSSTTGSCSCASRASCWKPSGCSPAPSTISR